MIDKLLRTLAPVAAMAMGAMVAGCDGMNIDMGNSEGVPLSELDMTGAAPNAVVLASPDSVVVTDGDALSIDVEGSPEVVEAMRFSLEKDTLAIMRAKGVRDLDGVATVRVTMPPPGSIVLAGSGGIAAQSLGSRADITIAGSGRVDVASLAAERLEATIAGSGTLGAAGSVSNLEMTIAGSGNAEMDELQVERAEITIAGSGDGAFASDGRVEASIVGSGEVTVYGRADCTVSSMGSGKLNCRNVRPVDEPAAK